MQYLQQEELERLSARSLPIKSGDGQRPATAYRLIKIKQLEAPGIEHIIIDLILKASGYVFWQLDHQAFTIINDREIDKLKVLAIKNSKTREFSFYFDITALG